MDKLLEEIAKMVETVADKWDTYILTDKAPEGMPTHREFAQQVLTKVQAYYASLVGDEELLTPEEQDAYYHYTDNYTLWDLWVALEKVIKAQAAKSKAVHLETDCDTCTYKRVSLGGMED